ncbi:hypothetical protein K443DRAFT_13752 [Laccaria amethystina LaAM-08-1]|uniref:Cytochrome c oxidase assembly factor 6 n=1 Tax=Laccaria amethystina LaAM-08-1 TaxID=1095629 RepID=A0A0C9WNS6_9AGAR|nr:hypothetical protein K443DRAFT_13752 [Laccaria amethystina LaAM-08-1]
MGWFSSSSKTEEPGAPSREDRKKCWETRDAYFTCLNSVGVVKAGGEGNACGKEKKRYEDSCAKSWIDYFNQRRVIADAQRERLAQGGSQAGNTRR